MLSHDGVLARCYPTGGREKSHKGQKRQAIAVYGGTVGLSRAKSLFCALNKVSWSSADSEIGHREAGSTSGSTAIASLQDRTCCANDLFWTRNILVVLPWDNSARLMHSRKSYLLYWTEAKMLLQSACGCTAADGKSLGMIYSGILKKSRRGLNCL